MQDRSLSRCAERPPTRARAPPQVIYLALPKGHMQENVSKMLKDAGIKVSLGNARGYRPTVPLPNYDVKLLKVRRVPRVAAWWLLGVACRAAAPRTEHARASLARPHRALTPAAMSSPRSRKTSWACWPRARATGWRSWASTAS